MKKMGITACLLGVSALGVGTYVMMNKKAQNKVSKMLTSMIDN